MTLKEVFGRMNTEKKQKIEKFRCNYLIFSKKKIRYIEQLHKNRRVSYYKLYWCNNCPVVFLSESVLYSDIENCPYCKNRSYQLNGQTIAIVKPDKRKLEDVTIRE